MNVAEEEVILWVTSDLCGSTSVQQTPVVETTSVPGSAIPVALISRSQEDLTDGNITETTFEACKEEYCIVEDDMSPPKEKKSRKRGMVWNYFVPTEQDRAQCSFCSAVISYKGKSTNNLLRHLRTKHSENPMKETKIENFQSEDGSTYYVLSAPDQQIHSPNSESSFMDDEDAEKNNKRRGGVWKYFKTGKNSRAKCKFCSTIISFKGGSTTNLLRHMKSKHTNIKVPHKIKSEDSFKIPSDKSLSIQHSFAEIVSECVKSDDENEFTLHTVHYDGNSNDDTDPIATETITTLSSMEPYTHEIDVMPSEVIETTKERRKSAVAWKYFEMENEDRARCGVCNAVISFKGGSTGNLLRHLKTKHTELDLTQPEKKEEIEEPPPEPEDLGFDSFENQELAKFVQLLNPKYKLQGVQVPKLTEKEQTKRIRKRGAALSYFTVIENEYGTCQLCAATVMLKNGSKAPLLRHLKSKHPDVDSVLMANGNQSSSDEASSTPIVQNASVNIENIENIPMQVVTCSNAEPPKDKSTRKMRKRGLVWNHFAPLEDERAKCISCPAVISYKRGSTSNLLRHMKKKHPEIDVHDEDPLKQDDAVEVTANTEEDEDDVDVDGADGSAKKKMLRKRGRVWNHFKPVEPDKAKCGVCSAVVVYLKGSTTNLLRHLKKKHPSIDLTKEKPFNKRLVYPKERAVTETPKPPTPTDFLGETSSTEKVNAIYKRSEIIFRKHFDKFLNRPVSVTKSKLYDEQLAKMIVKQYCPFTIVESDEFKKFVQTVNPGYSLPSRKTISSRLIPELYEKCVDEVRDHLRNVRYVTITTNGWTLVNNECYISITAHFIDDDCKYQSFLLDCFKYEEKHTAENLAAEIKSILTDWGLIHKVNAVVSDNAANITAAIRLRSWRHIPCFANMLNLVIQAGLFEIRETHDKAKLIVDYFKKNPIAAKKLQCTQVEMGLAETKLKQDDISRWESTYDMFNRLLASKDALLAVVESFVETLPMLNHYEWTLLEKTSEVLKPLFDITNEVSEKNITISKVIPLSKCIGNYLQKLLQDKYQIKEINLMVSKMSDEVTLRFNDVEDNTLLAESTLLDPRFKNQAFTNDQSYSNTYHSILQKASNTKVTDKQGDEKGGKSKDGGNVSSIWEEFDSKVTQGGDTQNPETAAATEMENYLQETLLARNADPLVWWHERRSLYPRLYEIMKQRLCIAATAVSKNFTNSGHLVCEKRNKLSSSKVSMVLFLNHNL